MSIIYKIIKCHFTEELDLEVIESIGKDVRITGQALINDKQEISSVRNVTDIRQIEPGTWSFEKIRWQNRIFKFNETVSVKIDFEDDTLTSP